MSVTSGLRGLQNDRDAARQMFEDLSRAAPGTPEHTHLRDRLVEMHLPLVEHLARRFRDRGEPLDDLIQVGTIGLIKAVDRFDLERAVEFSTYATPTIVGEIKRHFRDKGWAIRVPRRLQELRLSLTAATSELSQRNGRSPTVAELAEFVGAEPSEVVEGLESAGAYTTLSLDAPDRAGEDAPPMGHSIGMEDADLLGVEHREALRPILERLPVRERRIVVLRFYRELTQSQIAAQLGISQMHVSRLLAKTLSEMRESLLTD